MVIDNQLNPKKYTKEQLEQNAADADAYANVVANATNARAADYAAYAADNADAAYWLGRYFIYTCENKQDYIDAINKDNKQ